MGAERSIKPLDFGSRTRVFGVAERASVHCCRACAADTLGGRSAAAKRRRGATHRRFVPPLRRVRVRVVARGFQPDGAE